MKGDCILVSYFLLLQSSRFKLAKLNVLKKICDHPRLLSSRAYKQLSLDEQARFVLQF